MSFHLKTENYNKPPSAEMRKLWTEAWGLTPATMLATRIEFSLTVKEKLAAPGSGAMYKELLKTWRERRERERAERKALGATMQTQGGQANAASQSAASTAV
jgi:hypothetical protein